MCLFSKRKVNVKVYLSVNLPQEIDTIMKIFCKIISPLLLLSLLIGVSLSTGCSRSTGPAEAEAASTDSTAERVDSTHLLVMTVRGCSRLYLTEMHIRKLVTFTDEPTLRGTVLGMPVDMPTRWGKRRIAIPIDVTLKAYVDMAEFDEANVERTDSTLTLTLPDIHITSTASKIDNAGIRQYVDMTRSRYTDAEITKLAQQGEQSILSHLSQYGLEQEAQRSAARQLLPLLQGLGYEDGRVNIRFRKTYSDGELLRMTQRK